MQPLLATTRSWAFAAAWHDRVIADEIVSHAFSHGFHPQHTERLAAYWAVALGGPARYSDLYGGESMVVRMHSGNGPHEEMDRRAIVCFDEALVPIRADETEPTWYFTRGIQPRVTNAQ